MLGSLAGIAEIAKDAFHGHGGPRIAGTVAADGAGPTSAAPAAAGELKDVRM